ncbi:MAG TPA: transposase [Candidatus Avanaerovorax faecigallinarum]|nr:transposase [Candidatus Avanaerovorax faecigallinarum]
MLRKFKTSIICQYEEFSDILITCRKEILHFFKRPYNNRKLSNSVSENINGKIRSYLPVSRGVSNFQRFRKRALLGLSKDIRCTLRSQLHSVSVPNPRMVHTTNIRVNSRKEHSIFPLNEVLCL